MASTEQRQEPGGTSLPLLHAEPTWPSGLTLWPTALDTTSCEGLEDFLAQLFARGRAGDLKQSFVPKPAQWQETGQGRATLHLGRALVKFNKVLWGASVAPLPLELERVLDRLGAAGLFLPEQRPDCCCVNEYEPGAWIPPHVDSLSFARPFFTLSLQSVQSTVFGEGLRSSTPEGEFEGGVRIALPRGSVLRVDGAAGGPVVQHAVCRCTAARYSLVFRRLSDASLVHLANLQAAAESSAAARRERRLAAKLERGWTPRSQAMAAKAGAALQAGQQQQPQQQHHHHQQDEEPPRAASSPPPTLLDVLDDLPGHLIVSWLLPTSLWHAELSSPARLRGTCSHFRRLLSDDVLVSRVALWAPPSHSGKPSRPAVDLAACRVPPRLSTLSLSLRPKMLGTRRLFERLPASLRRLMLTVCYDGDECAWSTDLLLADLSAACLGRLDGLIELTVAGISDSGIGVHAGIEAPSRASSRLKSAAPLCALLDSRCWAGLRHLDLSAHHLAADHGTTRLLFKLATKLPTHRHLLSLALRHSEVTEETLRLLVGRLPSTLRRLDLSHNLLHYGDGAGAVEALLWAHVDQRQRQPGTEAKREFAPDGLAVALHEMSFCCDSERRLRRFVGPNSPLCDCRTRCHCKFVCIEEEKEECKFVCIEDEEAEEEAEEEEEEAAEEEEAEEEACLPYFGGDSPASSPGRPGGQHN